MCIRDRNNTNQDGAQSETNNASATDAPSVSNASNPVNTQSEASDTSEEAEDTPVSYTHLLSS